MGRLNRSSCRSYIKVRSDHQRSGVIFLLAARRGVGGDIGGDGSRQAAFKAV